MTKHGVIDMSIEWQKLPEGWDERFTIRGRGVVFLEIAISVFDHETGETRLGSMNGVEATARREEDGRITLFVSDDYAEMAAATKEEVLAALLGRLATLNWGVKMYRVPIEAPQGVFTGV